MRTVTILIITCAAILASAPLHAQIKVRLVHQIGEEDGPAALEYPSDAMRLGDKVYVLQPQQCKGLVFNLAGDLISEFGRCGGGPGEFGWPAIIGAIRDTIWVFDSRRREVTFFSAEGKYIKSFVARDASRVVPVASGKMVKVVPTFTDSASRNGFATVVLTTNRQPVSIAVQPFATQVLSVQGATMTRTTRQPLSDSPMWVTSRNGEWLLSIESPAKSGAHQQYSITRMSVLSRKNDVVRVTFPLEPTTRGRLDRVVDEWISTQMESAAGMNIPVARNEFSPRVVRESLYVPRYFPAVQRALVTSSGSIWLHRFEGGGKSGAYVFLSRGQPNQTLTLDRDIAILDAGDDYLLGVKKDDLGVPYVQVLHVK